MGQALTSKICRRITVKSFVFNTLQRNLRDSNPRRILTLGALVKHCLKPLGQDSKLPRYDSNVHVFRRLINSQVRLPFRHEALVPGLRLERRNADPKSAVIPFHHPGSSSTFSSIAFVHILICICQ